jgi:hypothetical protein
MNLIITSEWVPIPALVGALLYLGQLSKARTHKYIRRVPYAAKDGKTRYRYYYNVRGGKGVGHEDEIKERSAFRIKHGDHEGHFHVEKVDGDKVTVVHDESGHKVTMTRKAFSEMIRNEHAEAIDEHHEAVRKEHKATTVPGMRKQVEKRAEKYGVKLAAEDKASKKPEEKPAPKPVTNEKKIEDLQIRLDKINKKLGLGAKVHHAVQTDPKVRSNLEKRANKLKEQLAELKGEEPPEPKLAPPKPGAFHKFANHHVKVVREGKPHQGKPTVVVRQKNGIETTILASDLDEEVTAKQAGAGGRAYEPSGSPGHAVEPKEPKLAPLERADLTKLVDNAETVARLVDNRLVGAFRRATDDAFKAGEKALKGGRFEPQVENMKQDLRTIAQILKTHDRKPGFSDNPDVRKLRDQLAILGVVTKQAVEKYKPPTPAPKPISPRRVKKVTGTVASHAKDIAQGSGLAVYEYSPKERKHLKAFASAAVEGKDLPEDVDLETVREILADEYSQASADAKREPGTGASTYARSVRALHDMAVEMAKKLSKKVEKSYWREIPEHIGERLWKAYGHLLVKGAGHKYIRRVPYTDAHGRRRYRYFYHVTGKRGLAHEDEIKEKSAFKVTHDGQEGHFHVTKVDGNKVVVEHDESGKSVEMTKEELREMLHKEHAELIQEHVERTKERMETEKKAVEKPGREKYKEAYLKRWDAYQERYSWLASGGLFVAPDSDMPWDPTETPAIQAHYDLMPKKTVKLDKGTINFPNPTKEKKELFVHQVDGAERTWTSFKKGTGMLVQDDAGLGKTLTGLAALHHGITKEGVKRALICVPGRGKKGIANQWKTDAKLYGIDVREANEDQEAMDNMDEGVWSVAYDHHDFYDTVEEEVWDEKREAWRKEKRVELKPWLKNFDMVIFDESHNLAGTSKPGEMSNIAQAAVQMHGQIKNNQALYLSATPFTNVRDMHYLRALGWFKTGSEFKDWAEQVGCTLDAGTMGDVPAKINNPTTHLPMVQIAAVSHVDGTSIKRTTTMEGLTSNFHESTLESLIESPSYESALHEGKTIAEVHPELANIYKDAKKTFNLAEQMFKVAQEYGYGMALPAQKTNWQKSYWETLKVVDAIKHGERALAEGKQVGFFTNYHQYSNSIIGGAGPDRGLAATFRRRAAEAEELGDYVNVEYNLEAADKLDRLAAKLPPVTNPVDILVEHFGGPGKVAEAHGRTNKTLVAEQKAFQDGDKTVMVGTVDKAGTGLDWHDKYGYAAREQVNLGLPWTGKSFTQLSGRMQRLGSKSDTQMHWLLGDNDVERTNATTVAARLRSMGALVAGDPDMAVDAAQLAAFESGLDITAEEFKGDLLGVDVEGEESAEDAADKQGEKESKKKKGQTLEGQEARDHFRGYAEARYAGRDVLAEEHERRKQKRFKTIRRTARKIGSALQQHGVIVGPDADPEKFRVFAKDYYSRKDLKRHMGRIRKGKEHNSFHGDYTVNTDALLKLAEKYNVPLGGRGGILSEEEFDDMQNPSRLTEAERRDLEHRKEVREYKKLSKQEKLLKTDPANRRRAEGVHLTLGPDRIPVEGEKGTRYLVSVGTSDWEARRWRPMLQDFVKSDPFAAENQPPYAYNTYRIPADRLDELLNQMESGSTVQPKPKETKVTVPKGATPTSPPPSQIPKPPPTPAEPKKTEAPPAPAKEAEPPAPVEKKVEEEPKPKSVTQRLKDQGFNIGGIERHRGMEVVLLTGPETKKWKENIKDHAKRGGLSPRDAWDRARTGWRVPATELEKLANELETGTPKEAPARSGGSYYGRRRYYRRSMPDNVKLVINVPR